MSVWKYGNHDNVAIAESDGTWRLLSIRVNSSTWYDNAPALPKWAQKDISLLKWMPNRAWCSLGMREEGYGREIGVTFYYLFSPVLRKMLSQQEKENQNEQY